MKILKQSLLTVTLLTISATTLPHYYHDSGVGAGLLGAGIGMGVGYAIGKSGNNEDPGKAAVRSVDRDIRNEQKSKKQLTRDYNKGKITKSEHDARQAEHDENIKSLRKQRVMATA